MSFEKLFETLGDLPVASIAHEVTRSVMDGAVTTLSSDTGSGKTLYQSAHLADTLNKQVIVLVPSKFLAVNAAETVAELSGCEIGKDVGYAVGSQTGNRSLWNSDTKLVFATNGYALASGLVNTATTFILDEVHETSLDLSIVRALLHRRIACGESINVLEMSATMDTRRQSMYWKGIARTNIFAVDGKTFDCELRHRPTGRVEDEVMNLIHEGRRGILVFRPGVGEVEDTAKEIRRLAKDASMEVEVSEIYGELSHEERAAAAACAPGKVKVLVGTNVVESGVNIPWLDAGVSCGTGKESNVRLETGATRLELVDLPQWRLRQQEGRVKRFRPGVFVLCSPFAFNEREQASRPEIERLALTELVMHCAGFGLRSHELTFDYVPDTLKVAEAELTLQRLGLIDETCLLTEAGKWIIGLPVGPETGAMLWHAHQLDCLPEMLPLAAVIEVGRIRKDYRRGHEKDSTSDYLDSLVAFHEASKVFGKERRAVLELDNIGYKRFQAASDLLSDLQRRLSVSSVFASNKAFQRLRQCILAGSLNRLFIPVGYRGDLVQLKEQTTMYRIGHGAVLSWVEKGKLIAGDLRVITPKNKNSYPFTVIEKVTLFDLEDLQAVAKIRPEILVEEIQDGLSATAHVLKLFGEHVVSRTFSYSARSADDQDYGSGNTQLLGDVFAARWR